MTYQSTVRRLTLVTAILVAIGLTLFLTAPFGKGISLAQASAENNPATGAPTISGTAQVGETLTAGITGIADADGLSGETFTYQWVSGDGTTDTDIENATGATYKLVDADQGRFVKVRVTLTDGGGNEETLTSAPTGPVWGDGPPGAPRNLTATPGNKEVTLSWDPPADNGNAPATGYRIEWRVDGKDYDKTIRGTARSTTYTTNVNANLANGVKYFFRVRAGNGSGYSYGPYGPASEEVSATPTSGSAVNLGTPVLSDTETLHHGMVQLDWEDIEDAGWYVVQYYHVEGGEWLDLPAEGVDIAFHGSSAVVSNLHGLSWLRVGAMSCAGASEWSQIEQLFGTSASDWEGVPVPEVEAGDEIEPCPVVLGTPVLSDTETLHHGMVRLDWQDIEDAGWYVVQYYHVKGGEWVDLPAEGVDIAFHGSSAVVSNLHGLSWLRVRAMSCAGESEWSQIEQLFGTNASDWEGVPVPEVAEGDEIEPCSEDADTSDNSPATGAPTISGTAQVGETLTANTSGIVDADGLGNVQYEYQWLADDSEISGATNATYTLTDSEESKNVTVQVSFTDDGGNAESLTSAATAPVAAKPNSPATGTPTISGTAQVGETLTAGTSGVADADGLSNVQYEYQWLADDADISGATNATYTLATADEGKAIKVQVGFTDDAGNEETLTSAATAAVAARPNAPLSDLDRLRRFIATDVVEAHESSHPWLRTTWEYMKSGFELKVSSSSRGGGSVEDGCSYEDGLQKCRAEVMKIGVQSVNSLGVLLHEMAHVFTLTNGLLDEPAPLAAAHLYFYGLDIAEPLGFCRPGELLADILQLSVVGVGADQGSGGSFAGYWALCNGDYEAGQADPLTKEALTVVNSALSGQMPQWFADTYHDSNGNVDLEQLWSDIKSIPRGPGGRFLLAFSLREQFGGYCGNSQVAGVLDIASSSERVSDNEIRNPWRDGGCVPEAPSGLRIVPGSNQMELSWEAPVDDGGSSIRGYVVEWKSGDEDYDESRRTVIDDPSSNSHTVTGLTEGVEHTLRVTAFNVFGDGEYATVTNLNRPATGAPPISGAARVGETLTASTSGIADEDGLSDPTYSYKWIRNDGTTDSVIRDATYSTYTLTDDDAGKNIKVRVSFTDDGDNEETLTSDPTAVVAATVPGVPEHVRVTPHDSQALDVSWEAPTSDGGSAVTGYKVQWKKATGSWDTPEDVSEAVVTGAIHTIAGLTEGTAYSVRVLARNDVGDGSASAEQAATPRDITPPSLSKATVNEEVMTLTYDEALDENSVPASETFSVTAGDAATTVDSVSVSGSSVTLTLSSAVTTDVAVTVSYAVPAGQTAARAKDLAGNPAPALSSQAVVNVTEQSGNDNPALWSATMTVGASGAGAYGYSRFWVSYGELSDRTITLDGSVYRLYSLGHNSYYLSLALNQAITSAFLLRLDGFEFASDDASTQNGDIAYVYSWPKGQLSWSLGDQVQVSVVQVETSEQPEPAENTPATGAPTIDGMAQVGETLTADATGVIDADGLSNVQYEYQWLADDADIAGATGSTYTLTDSEESKVITVRVSFTDDTGNEETLTSAATGAVDARPNSPATGAPTITGTAQVGQTLTADTSGIADADGLANATFSYQWLADDTDIAGATGLTYTLTDSEESKAITVQVSFTDAADNEETLTSAATAAVAAAPQTNSPATGTPDISGTAQVGETLAANTSGIADADGLSSVQYEYQWLADDSEISGATNATYTLTDSEESKAITVQVSFTDDTGNGETLTSAATAAVAGAQPTEPPDKPTGLEATATHDSVTLTWDNSGDDTITGYVILRRIPGVDPEGHFNELVANTGTAATTYTDDTVSAETRYTYRIKAINGAGTSERSRWSHIDTPAAPVPAKPTGLEATESHGQVVLTWDDPGDDTITGYVILRRVRVNNTGGDFSVLVADTGTAVLTYTDDTVAASITYTYRIKAINEHGTSERSRWFHIDIPEAP